MKNLQKSALYKLILIVLMLSASGFVGWYTLLNKTENTTTESTDKSQVEPGKNQEAIPENEENPATDTIVKLETYKVENEGLKFSYNPVSSSVLGEAPNTEEGLYEVVTKVSTGAVVLNIDAGISGIGGYMPCENIDRGSCEVIDTVEGTYLGEKVKYILVKASLPDDCGYSGKPDCNVAPLVTSYYIDTYESSEAPYGSCCGTLSSNARNLGNKAEIAGRVLITIQPDKSIQNEDMLKNKDMLETFKIIESISYAAE
jgi:hypothetical protein